MESIPKEQTSEEAYVTRLNEAGHEKEKKSFSQRCLRWMKDTQSIFYLIL